MRTPHTSCKKGKRVQLIFRDGTRTISKFIEKKGGSVYLENGRYPIPMIRSFGICGTKLIKKENG